MPTTSGGLRYPASTDAVDVPGDMKKLADDVDTYKAPIANPTITGVLSVPDGTVSAPAITNTGDTDTGTYFPDANTVGITAGGVEAARFTSTGIASPSMVELQQFSADLSVLRNLPSRVHPAESLLKQAVWWIDAAHSSASGQTVSNLGWGGSVLDATVGSTGSADSNDAKYLDWTGENYVYLPGVTGNYLSVPDAANLDITGDLDVRVKVAMDDWTPSAASILAAKSTGSGNQQSWYMTLSTGGNLALRWSTDGATLQSEVISTAATGVSDGAVKWVRATLDVDNGASGNDVKFFTSDDGVSWSQLGSTVTTAGITSVFASTAVVEVGTRNAGTTGASTGKVYRAQILNGIDGTPVLDIDTSLVSSGSATSFTARTGQTVTINRSTSGRKAVAVTHPVWLLGTDDYLEVSDNALLDMGAATDFTVLAIVRRWATPNNYSTIIAKKHVDTVASAGWAVNNYTTSANLRTEVADGTNSAVRQNQADGNYTLGAISLLGMRVDRTAQTQQSISGSTLSSTTSMSTVGSLDNSWPLRIGRDPNSTGYYSDMEFVGAAVWRRALTADEIRILNDYFKGRAA